VSRRCHSCDHAFGPDVRRQKLCWPCLREQPAKPRTAVVPPIDAEPLKLAISLCHPDPAPTRTGGPLCNRVTGAPLEAIEAVREAA
jgi:hypothetical protein